MMPSTKIDLKVPVHWTNGAARALDKKCFKMTSPDRERSGSVVEFLTQDRGALGSSLTGVIVLWSLSKTHSS